MIEVTVVETGDSAQADDPETALYAARIIAEEARQHRRMWGFDPSVRFEVDGTLVRVMTLSALNAS
jgi:hypothetical protein